MGDNICNQQDNKTEDKIHKELKKLKKNNSNNQIKICA